MSGLREYLAANMFDGDDGGSLGIHGAPIATLLDEICENVTHFLVDSLGTGEYLESYYRDEI